MEEILNKMAESFQRHEQLLEMLARTQEAQIQATDRFATAQAERARRQPELKVEGLTMPKYHGRMDESISLYIHQVTTFFKAKNVDFQADDGTQLRCIAMMVANFRGLAAAWYQERLHSRGEVPSTLLELENELRDEFEPDDLQDRLRDQLYELKQAHCASLTEYVAKFRRICTQICDMTERDKVSWFQRGLRTRTREELQYRRCETVTAAIQVALDYERSHSLSLGDRHHRDRDRNNRHDHRPQHGHYDRRNAHSNQHRHQGSRPQYAAPARQRQEDD
ncbi:hypothetical protein As57867_019174, partial [Aphanomyces stellatus]